MNIQETIISRTYENKFREFFITLKIKPSDISLDEREACRAACEQGTLMKGDLEKFQEEKSLLREPAKLKGETIYQRFKRVCIDYSGVDYYNRLKMHIGVEHLIDLTRFHSESMVEDVFKCQIWLLEDRKLGLNTNPPQWMVSGLTHKDNALALWHELFNEFNNPKT